MKETARIYKIVDTATGKVVREFTTKLTGDNLSKFEDGLYAKVNFDRFHVEQEEVT